MNVLESEGGYNIYAGANYHRVAEYNKDCGFYEFLHKFHINMILFGGRLQHDERFEKDKQWKDFLSNYKDFGFVKRTIPNSGFELFLVQNIK